MKKDFYKNNRGNIAIIVAISLTVLIGMLAIVIDGGWLYASKNKYQNGVEAAAMAGAVSLCDGDPDDSARLIAQENGLPFDESSLEVQIGFYDEKDIYENFPVYKDFVAEGEAWYPEEEFNNAVMVKLNATEETLMGGFVGKDEVTVEAAAVAYLKRYGLLSLGQEEGDGIEFCGRVSTGTYNLLKKGDIHANGDIKFTSANSDSFEGTIEETVRVTSGGSITGIDFGVSGADAVNIKPISLYVDELKAKADFIYTEDDFPEPLAPRISRDGNEFRHGGGTVIGEHFDFIPHEGNHDGAIYYFDFSEESSCLDFRMVHTTFSSSDRITNLTIASNASIVSDSTSGEVPDKFMGGGGYTFQFISKKDIGWGGPFPYGNESRGAGQCDGVLLMAVGNVFLDGGYGRNQIVRMIAGKSIGLGTINGITRNFNFNTPSPCPPVFVKLGKL